MTGTRIIYGISRRYDLIRHGIVMWGEGGRKASENCSVELRLGKRRT